MNPSSNVPIDLQGASRLNILGEDDGFLEYQERVWTLVKQIEKDGEGYTGHYCDEEHGTFDPNNSECNGY